MKMIKLLLLLAVFGQATLQSKNPDLCYCSDKCGPRNVGDRHDDKPFYGKDGQCFCQQRDEDNYIKNGCNIKESQKRSQFLSYCQKNN